MNFHFKDSTDSKRISWKDAVLVKDYLTATGLHPAYLARLTSRMANAASYHYDTVPISNEDWPLEDSLWLPAYDYKYGK